MSGDMPESYRMASNEVRRFFETVRSTAKEILQNHRRLTSQQAEDELGRLFESAFENALARAMEISQIMPVQPDWLMTAAACEMWCCAHNLCGIQVDWLEFAANVPAPQPNSEQVLPSPEHLAMIEGNTAKQATAFSQQTSTSADRGDRPSGGGIALTAAQEVCQRIAAKHGKNAAYNKLGRSTVSRATDASELPLPTAQAIRDIRAGEEKRANDLAKARKVIFKLAETEADPDPDSVLNYRLDVPNADPETMAILWDAFKVADQFPAREGFTCTGRPWEVEVRRSLAKLFFGNGFCHKDAILEIAEKSGTAEIYAYFEDKFLHIGVTTQKNTLPKLGNEQGVEDHMHSAKKLFDLVADWARSVDLGVRQSFTDYRRSVIRKELNSMGISLDKSLIKSEDEEVAVDGTSAGEEHDGW